MPKLISPHESRSSDPSAEWTNPCRVVKTVRAKNLRVKLIIRGLPSEFGPDTEVFLWDGAWRRILLDRPAVVHLYNRYAVVYAIRELTDYCVNKNLSLNYLMIKTDLVHTYKSIFTIF
jgi:hypothetical protein